MAEFFEHISQAMGFEAQVNKLKEIIENSDNIVALTGAGISVPSGIPDFRSSNGIYRMYGGRRRTPEYMLSHTCLVREREEFYKFYKETILHPEALPNAAHYYLANLEKRGKLKTIITQNIDGLHEAAGSKNVITFHGTVLRNYCTLCQKQFPLSYILESDGVPKCDRCGSMVRPDVVLYGETIEETNLDNSLMAILNADVLLVIGTSLSVYPAANLVSYYHGKKLVIINRSPSEYDSMALLKIDADIINVVNALKG